jgi:hypothetical protein
VARGVISNNHFLIYAAEAGSKLTLEPIKLRYWRPGMRLCFDKFVQEYEERNRIKQGNECNSPLGELVEPNCPLQLSRVVSCGPHPLTRGRNMYFFTFIYHLTDHADTVPIPDMLAETCVRAYAMQIIVCIAQCHCCLWKEQVVHLCFL